MDIGLRSVRWTGFSFITMIFVLIQAGGLAQEQKTLTIHEEMMLEAQATGAEDEVEDDGYLLTLNEFRKHPIVINTSDENAFRELRILTDLQIHQLLSY